MDTQELTQQIETQKQSFLAGVEGSKDRAEVLKEFEELVMAMSQKLVAELKDEGVDKPTKLEEFKNGVISLADKFKDN
jgi:hypothetical protein